MQRNNTAKQKKKVSRKAVGEVLRKGKMGESKKKDKTVYQDRRGTYKQKKLHKAGG